jgi:LemA protein
MWVEGGFMTTALLVGIGLFVVICILIYNSLIHKKANVDNAFSGIDVQLTKRQDLIVKLIEVAKQYMKFESETLQQIVKLRSQALSASDLASRMKVENQMTAELSKFQLSVEAYPELKTNQQFVEVQRAMVEIEEHLAAARRTFNAAVTSYNVSLQTFPSSLFSSVLGFSARELFVAEEQKRADVDVKKLFQS